MSVVRRQYSLPNVSLRLEGWSSESTEGSQIDLAIVTAVECHFLPQQQVLKGGKELLDALTASAGRYAQDILGDLTLHYQDANTATAPGQLYFRPAERSGFHHLSWQPQAAEGATAATSPIEFELATVQLFDLVEAVDQFLLDSTTVPEMAFQVTPRPKGIRRSERPLTQRAAPAALGITGFVAAAAVLVMVPAPEVREVEPERVEERQEGETSAGALPEGIASNIAGVPRLQARSELEALASQTRRRIDTAWQERGLVREVLSYRLWVAPTGEIIGFEAVGGRRPASEAPVLPGLLAPAADPQTLSTIAELRATFNGSGTVTVEPWTAAPPAE